MFKEVWGSLLAICRCGKTILIFAIPDTKEFEAHPIQNFTSGGEVVAGSTLYGQVTQLVLKIKITSLGKVWNKELEQKRSIKNGLNCFRDRSIHEHV